MSKVGCVIVTFNKLALLKECLHSVMNQTRKVDLIFVMDNCSTDGTEDFMKLIMSKDTNIRYFRLNKNIGGAGGFNFGLKKAYESDVDLLWIMDDDTVPDLKSLENLMEHAENPNLEWGFLSSNVKWIDGSACLMNIPETNLKWNDMAEDGLIRIDSASFVSLLIKKDTLDDVGYPIKEFFIWNDDTEFTRRISKINAGYFVSKSVVLHKMVKNNLVNIIKDDRIDRYYFGVRNGLYTAKLQGKLAYFKCLSYQLITIAKIIVNRNDHKLKKVQVVIKGIFAGMTFNPHIERTSRNTN